MAKSLVSCFFLTHGVEHHIATYLMRLNQQWLTPLPRWTLYCLVNLSNVNNGCHGTVVWYFTTPNALRVVKPVTCVINQTETMHLIYISTMQMVQFLGKTPTRRNLQWKKCQSTALHCGTEQHAVAQVNLSYTCWWLRGNSMHKQVYCAVYAAGALGGWSDQSLIGMTYSHADGPALFLKITSTKCTNYGGIIKVWYCNLRLHFLWSCQRINIWTYMDHFSCLTGIKVLCA